MWLSIGFISQGLPSNSAFLWYCHVSKQAWVLAHQLSTGYFNHITMTPRNLRKKELVLVPGCRGLESITSGKARHDDRSRFHTGSVGVGEQTRKERPRTHKPHPRDILPPAKLYLLKVPPWPPEEQPAGTKSVGEAFLVEVAMPVSQGSEKGDCRQPLAPSFSLSLPSALVDHFCPEFCAYHSSRASLYNSGSPLKSVPWFMLSASSCECTEN